MYTNNVNLDATVIPSPSLTTTITLKQTIAPVQALDITHTPTPVSAYNIIQTLKPEDFITEVNRIIQR
jgi:hypothetical protein